jgi:hypothetical protein
MPTSPANLAPTPTQSLLQDLPPWLQSPWAIALLISLVFHSLLLAWISQPRRQNLIRQSAPVKVVELPSSALNQLPATVLGGDTLPGLPMSSSAPGTNPLVPLSPSIFSRLPASTLPSTPSPGLLSLQPFSLLSNLLPPPPPLGLDELPSRTVAKPPETRRPTLTIPAPPTATSTNASTDSPSETPPETEAQPADAAPAPEAANPGDDQSNDQATAPAAPETETPPSTAAAPSRPQLAYNAALTSGAEVAQQRETFLSEAREKLNQTELALPPARLQNLAASGPGCFAPTAQAIEFMALVDGDGKPIIPVRLIQSSGYPDLNKAAEALMAQQSLPRPGQPYLLRVSLKFSPPQDCPSSAA